MGTSGRANRIRAWRTAVAGSAALHLALVAALVAIGSGPKRPAEWELPVALVSSAPPPVPALPPAGKQPVARLPERPRGIRLRGAPAVLRHAVPPQDGARPFLSSVALLQGWRDGTAADDSTATGEEALRDGALRGAIARWNGAFAEMIPEVRSAMFLEALEDSPFPRR